MEAFNVSVATLDDVKAFKAPPFQRKINQEHVRVLLEGLLKEKNKTGKIVPIGTIPVARFGDDLYLLDGQHRREAFITLNEPHQFLVQEFSVENEKEMFELFLKINNNRPVEQYVLAPATNDTKAATDKLMAYIQKVYSGYISADGVNPHHPNITLKRLTDVVHMIPGYDTWTPDNVIDKFEEFNLACKKQLETSRKREDWSRVAKSHRAGTIKPLYINRALIEMAAK